jgi:hypothetical protein
MAKEDRNFARNIFHSGFLRKTIVKNTVSRLL